MPVHMFFVGQRHALVLDTQTDKSHLVKRSTPNDYLFTFDANGAGYPPSGEIVCHIRQRKNMLYLENNLGIEAAPVSTQRHACYFEIEADFLNQWLVLQFEGAAP